MPEEIDQNDDFLNDVVPRIGMDDGRLLRRVAVLDFIDRTRLQFHVDAVFHVLDIALAPKKPSTVRLPGMSLTLW